MVGLAPSGPSLQDVIILHVELIDNTNIPGDPLGLWMELERVRYRGSRKRRFLLHAPSGLCQAPSLRDGRCECP